MDPGTATIIAAAFGAAGTIIAAIIGYNSGRNAGYDAGERTGFKLGHEEGMARGQKHSIEKFMDVYREDVDRAIRFERADSIHEVISAARALVENVKTWRRIQARFAELLNGLIDELDKAIEKQDYSAISQGLKAIDKAYKGRRLAVETELRKSQI